MIDSAVINDGANDSPGFFDTRRGRYVLFAALYFSEGAPIGYIWWTLPTKLRASGAAIDGITTLVALVALPWSLKFLWAPLVDALRSPRWGRRHWIITAQIGMGVALVPLFWLDAAQSLSVVTVLFIVHAFCAATQDVAVDAFCIADVPEHERGAVNGWMQVGMLAGRAIFGGGIIYFEQYWGAGLTLPLMLVCIWSTTAFVCFARESRRDQEGSSAAGDALSALPAVDDPSGRVEEAVTPQMIAYATLEADAPRGFWDSLRRALSRPATWLGLLFAATAGAAFEALGALLGPMLIDLGWSEADVGLFRAVPCVIGMAVGALAGGFASDRLGRRASVACVGALLAVCVAFVAAILGQTRLDGTTLGVAVIAAHVLLGAFTASTYALFMDLTDPSIGGTQFSAFMGATNLCESAAAFAAGTLAARYGYAAGLLAMVAVSLAALGVVFWLKPQDDSESNRASPASD